VADTLSCLPCSEACSIEDLFAAIQYDPSDDFLDVFIIISKYQLTDKEIQASLKRHLEKDDSHIMHKFKKLFLANSERMIMPEGLQERTIRFYHEHLKHPGVASQEPCKQFVDS
jgi:lipoprotein NlpI